MNKFTKLLDKISNTDIENIFLIGMNILNIIYCGTLIIGGLFFLTTYRFNVMMPILLFSIIGVYNSIILIKYYFNKR